MSSSCNSSSTNSDEAKNGSPKPTGAEEGKATPSKKKGTSSSGSSATSHSSPPCAREREYPDEVATATTTTTTQIPVKSSSNVTPAVVTSDRQHSFRGRHRWRGRGGGRGGTAPKYHVLPNPIRYLPVAPRNKGIICRRYFERHWCEVVDCPFSHILPGAQPVVPRKVCPWHSDPKSACLRDNCQLFHGSQEELDRLHAEGAVIYRPGDVMPIQEPVLGFNAAPDWTSKIMSHQQHPQHQQQLQPPPLPPTSVAPFLNSPALVNQMLFGTQSPPGFPAFLLPQTASVGISPTSHVMQSFPWAPTPNFMGNLVMPPVINQAPGSSNSLTTPVNSGSSPNSATATAQSSSSSLRQPPQLNHRNHAAITQNTTPTDGSSRSSISLNLNSPLVTLKPVDGDDEKNESGKDVKNKKGGEHDEVGGK